MFTLGYSFKPWNDDRAIASGSSICNYIQQTAHENGIEQKVRFGHRVTRANWSSADALWHIEATRTDTGETVVMTASFVQSCTGYYRYDEGYTPEFAGIERFAGTVVHPQQWPKDLDYAGKRVVVIGSGATAVTLVPAMAEKAEHVTMLQRSPSYILSVPAFDPLAALLRRYVAPRVRYSVIRAKNVLAAMAVYEFTRRAPKAARRVLTRLAAKQLPADFEVGKHLNPKYNPWDQRLCLVPDNDLFTSLRQGDCSIVTDEIDSFDETGIALRSGAHLDADIVVTATGLQLLALGGVTLSVDGTAVDLSNSVMYKGIMLAGVPNAAFTIGYPNASWTLRADLVSEYVCRLLRHMDARGYAVATPQSPDASLPTEPFWDLTSGYLQRSMHLFPRQGATTPWRINQTYFKDLRLLKRGPVEDAMTFAGPPQSRNVGTAGRESVPVAV